MSFSAWEVLRHHFTDKSDDTSVIRFLHLTFMSNSKYIVKVSHILDFGSADQLGRHVWRALPVPAILDGPDG